MLSGTYAFQGFMDTEEGAEGPHGTFLSVCPRCAHIMSTHLWLSSTQSHDATWPQGKLGNVVFRKHEHCLGHRWACAVKRQDSPCGRLCSRAVKCLSSRAILDSSRFNPVSFPYYVGDLERVIYISWYPRSFICKKWWIIILKGLWWQFKELMYI